MTVRCTVRRTVVGVAAAFSLATLVTACATGQSGNGTVKPATAAVRAPETPQHSTTSPSAKASSANTSENVAAQAANRCTGNKAAQLVTVSIREQHMWLCHFGTLVLETAVTTGASALTADDATPTGTFHVQGRDRNSTLTLNTGQQYEVKYWIPFSAPLYGFHDSSWQNFPYGSPLYTTRGSHGCVHMPLRAIQFLYGWVHLGATVHIAA